MKPQLGDRVRVARYHPVEGTVFSTPESQNSTGNVYYVGLDNGAVQYPEEKDLTVLFRARMEYVNQYHLKPGDKVGHPDLGEGIVVGVYPDDRKEPYLVFFGSLDWYMEEKLTLIHAAGHPVVIPEETPAPPAMEPEEVMF